MYEDALREVLNRVYRNTDDCEMLSIKSAPAAADYWLRQGYSLEDTNELIKQVPPFPRQVLLVLLRQLSTSPQRLAVLPKV